MKRVILLVGLLLMVPGVLVGQVGGPTSGAMIEACKLAIDDHERGSGDLRFNSHLCLGMAVGFMQLGGMQLADGELHKYAFPDVCMPDGVTVKQIVRVFLKYADDNPKMDNLPLAWVMLASVREAFPCAN